ncbi:MAG: hypothetical protein KatS3mg033_0675 [Thermonema sp.]|uniref:protein kinase domain-containing protein n=1 Tax=Thermonema sp. TaxID=2231181 RepID=UPI0021DECFF5|nr:hypothetical protein [Thermonema sp.]GIV38875.1 MAG: hypothetical protein KatS3mg033_0675 [Thermonema sp.]
MDLLFNEQGQFTGFLMPKAEGVELEYLCSQDFEHYPEFQEHAWRKFYFSHPMVAYYRLRTAFNICAAVHALHQKGYVIGNLKPVNIFVLPNGLISIADLDSIQIHTKEGHFPSMAVTPEYAPPEAGTWEPEMPKQQSWDLFSLAVILYRFLVGIHPFTGTLKLPYDKLTTYEELIRHGFYPHGKKQKLFAAIPNDHQRLFALYPPQVAQTFIKVFDTCLFQPEKRPSALEWSTMLYVKKKEQSRLERQKQQAPTITDSKTKAPRTSRFKETFIRLTLSFPFIIRILQLHPESYKLYDFSYKINFSFVTHLHMALIIYAGIYLYRLINTKRTKALRFRLFVGCIHFIVVFLFTYFLIMPRPFYSFIPFMALVPVPLTFMLIWALPVAQQNIQLTSLPNQDRLAQLLPAALPYLLAGTFLCYKMVEWIGTAVYDTFFSFSVLLIPELAFIILFQLITSWSQWHLIRFVKRYGPVTPTEQLTLKTLLFLAFAAAYLHGIHQMLLPGTYGGYFTTEATSYLNAVLYLIIVPSLTFGWYKLVTGIWTWIKRNNT